MKKATSKESASSAGVDGITDSCQDLQVPAIRENLAGGRLFPRERFQWAGSKIDEGDSIAVRVFEKRNDGVVLRFDDQPSLLGPDQYETVEAVSE